MSPPPALSSKAEAFLERMGLEPQDLLGVRFSINVFIATTIVWGTLRWIGDSNPIWAIASMLAAADPQPEEARRMFKSRLANVAVGCAVGLTFLLVGGGGDVLLPFALAVTVLISSYLVRIKTMWRQAPITAAIVIAAEISRGSTLVGVESGLHKIAEVIFGCLVGLLVSLFMARLWLVRPLTERTEPRSQA